MDNPNPKREPTTESLSRGFCKPEALVLSKVKLGLGQILSCHRECLDTYIYVYVRYMHKLLTHVSNALCVKGE